VRAAAASAADVALAAVVAKAASAAAVVPVDSVADAERAAAASAADVALAAVVAAASAADVPPAATKTDLSPNAKEFGGGRLGCPFCFHRLELRHRKPDLGALVRFALGAYLPAVALHDPFDQRKPHSGPLELGGRVEPLEDSEELLGRCGIKSDPVVLDPPPGLAGFGADL
jgi:hypothetical protein